MAIDSGDDSAGPIFFEFLSSHFTTNRYELIGIVSWGYNFESGPPIGINGVIPSYVVFEALQMIFGISVPLIDTHITYNRNDYMIGITSLPSPYGYLSGLQPVQPQLSEHFGAGVIVHDVMEGSPASTMGLSLGSVIWGMALDTGESSALKWVFITENNAIDSILYKLYEQLWRAKLPKTFETSTALRRGTLRIGDNDAGLPTTLPIAFMTTSLLDPANTLVIKRAKLLKRHVLAHKEWRGANGMFDNFYSGRDREGDHRIPEPTRKMIQDILSGGTTPLDEKKDPSVNFFETCGTCSSAGV